MFGALPVNSSSYYFSSHKNIFNKWFETCQTEEEKAKQLSDLKKDFFFFTDLKELFTSADPVFLLILEHLDCKEIELFNDQCRTIMGEENFYNSLINLIKTNRNFQFICNKYSYRNLDALLTFLFAYHEDLLLSLLLPYLIKLDARFKKDFLYFLFLVPMQDLITCIETFNSLKVEPAQFMPQIVEHLVKFSSIQYFFTQFPNIASKTKYQMIFFLPRHERQNYASTLFLADKLDLFSKIPSSGKDRLDLAHDFFKNINQTEFELLPSTLSSQNNFSDSDYCYLFLSLLISYPNRESQNWDFLLNRSLPLNFQDFEQIEPLLNEELIEFLDEDLIFSEKECTFSTLKITIKEYMGENRAYLEDFGFIPPFLIAFLKDHNKWFFDSRLACTNRQLQALSYTLTKNDLKKIRYDFDYERFTLIFSNIDPKLQTQFIGWEKDSYTSFNNKASSLLEIKRMSTELSKIIAESQRTVNSTKLNFHLIYHQQSCGESDCFYERAKLLADALKKMNLSKQAKTENAPPLDISVYQEDFLFKFSEPQLKLLGIRSEADLRLFNLKSWRQWYNLRLAIIRLYNRETTSLGQTLGAAYFELTKSEDKDASIKKMVSAIMDNFNKRLQGLRHQLESKLKTAKIHLGEKDKKNFNLRWSDFEKNFNKDKEKALEIILSYLFNLQYKNDPMILLSRYCNQKEIKETWEQFNLKSFYQMSVIGKRCGINDLNKFLNLKGLYQEIITKSKPNIIF